MGIVLIFALIVISKVLHGKDLEGYAHEDIFGTGSVGEIDWVRTFQCFQHSSLFLINNL